MTLGSILPTIGHRTVDRKMLRGHAYNKLKLNNSLKLLKPSICIAHLIRRELACLTAQNPLFAPHDFFYLMAK